MCDGYSMNTKITKNYTSTVSQRDGKIDHSTLYIYMLLIYVSCWEFFFYFF